MLKSLNNEATRVFYDIVRLLSKERQYVVLDLERGYMPLHVEVVGLLTIELSHYGEQNGDLMADPLMRFKVGHDGIYPISYRNDYVGVNQDAMYDLNQQAGMANFANMWLMNIKEQQF